MPLISSFCGPSSTARSPMVNAEQSINVFSESVPSLKSRVLYGTPSLLPLVDTLASIGGCRGIWSQDGRTFAVIGTDFLEVNPVTLVVTVWGSGVIQNDGHPVSMAGNGVGGNQLVIVGGGNLRVFTLTTNTLSANIAGPWTNPPVMVLFFDTYFLILEASTIRVWFSAIEDGTSYNALNFFARSFANDNLVGIAKVYDRLVLIGSKQSELWYNSGNATTPFIPYQNAVFEYGALTQWSIVTVGPAVYWMAITAQGGPMILRWQDYTIEAISTPAVDVALASYSMVTDAEVLTYFQEGHTFICWTCPSAPDGTTWCWDVKESQWHQRNGWNATTGTWTRWLARGATNTSISDVVICGDYSGTKLYHLSLDTFTDNGQPRRWLRRAPYLSAENQWLFIDQLELAAQAGVGLVSGQGSLAQVALRISRDAANTWSDALWTTVGAIGRFANRAIWRRLGRTRSDRLVIEISQTDPVRPVWSGLWLRATQGSGLL